MGDGERYHCAQEVMATSSGVVGALMRFPFRDLHDRDPQNRETGVVLNNKYFAYMTRAIFDPRINNAFLEQSNWEGFSLFDHGQES